MSVTLFDSYLPIDRYNRDELGVQFRALAAATSGKYSEAALNWYVSGSQLVVRDIFWRGFPAGLRIEHDWTVHTGILLTVPAGSGYEIRFNNIYGSASGVPIIGPPRVESDLLEESLARLLPEASYWKLALAREPFAITLAKERLTLAVYRFYPCQFYLDALDYLSEMAVRLENMANQPLPVKPSVCPTILPWTR